MVLVGDGRAEQRHDAVPQELVDGALVAVDGGQHDLEDAVHDAVDLFGVEPLGHRREAGHVREDDADLLALAFHRRAAAEDLLGEMAGRVRLRRGEALGGGGLGSRGGRGRAGGATQRGAALTTELLAGRVRGLAGGTDHLQPAATLAAEFLAERVLVTAAAALHRCGECESSMPGPRGHCACTVYSIVRAARLVSLVALGTRARGWRGIGLAAVGAAAVSAGVGSAVRAGSEYGLTGAGEGTG